MDVDDLRFKRLILEGVEQAVRDAMYSWAIKTVAKIQTEVIPHYPRPPVDKGAAGFLGAWKYRMVGNTAYVFNNSPHASIIEYGARAGKIKPSKMMIQALKEWVIRKGIATKPTKAPATNGPSDIESLKKFNKAQKKHEDSTKAVMSAVWGIIGGMKKKGIFNDTTNGADTRGGLRVREKALNNWQIMLQKEFKDELIALQQRLSSRTK